MSRNFLFKCVFAFLLIPTNLLCGKQVFAQQNTRQPLAILSSRWFHPSGKEDSLNTVDVINALHPDRLDWTYCDKKSIIDTYKNLGLKFSIAFNPQVADSAGYTTAKTRLIDIDNKPFVAPWMKNWKIKNPNWGCVNNAAFKKIFFNNIQQAVDWGAYGIFVDDAIFNAQLQEFGGNGIGCFCDSCLAAFKTRDKKLAKKQSTEFKNMLLTEAGNYRDNGKLLKSNILKKYSDFQVNSVVKFYDELKKTIDTKGKQILLLTNNPNGKWNSIYKQFDIGIAEVEPKNLRIPKLDSIYNYAAQIGKRQLLSLVSDNDDFQDWLVIYNFITNHDYLIPWDIYIGSENRKRYYCDIKKFSGLKQILETLNLSSSSTNTNNIDEHLYIKSFKDKTTNNDILIILSKDAYHFNDSAFNLQISLSEQSMPMLKNKTLQLIYQSSCSKIYTLK